VRNIAGRIDQGALGATEKARDLDIMQPDVSEVEEERIR